MFNQSVKLDFTSSGHYCANIVDSEGKNIQRDDQVLASAGDVTPKKKRMEDEESQCEEEILTISRKNKFGRKTQNQIQSNNEV